MHIKFNCIGVVTKYYNICYGNYIIRDISPAVQQSTYIYGLRNIPTAYYGGLLLRNS